MAKNVTLMWMPEGGSHNGAPSETLHGSVEAARNEEARRLDNGALWTRVHKDEDLVSVNGRVQDN